MLGPDNCTHLVEKIKIAFLDLSCSFYIYENGLRKSVLGRQLVMNLAIIQKPKKGICTIYYACMHVL